MLLQEEQLQIENRIKQWKRKLKLSHTMLRKYESKLARLQKKMAVLSAQVAQAANPEYRAPAKVRVDRKFKLAQPKTV